MIALQRFNLERQRNELIKSARFCRRHRLSLQYVSEFDAATDGTDEMTDDLPLPAAPSSDELVSAPVQTMASLPRRQNVRRFCRTTVDVVGGSVSIGLDWHSS
jgi:hypothetical protein